jgi:multicomponent Na+:H+ antiporter subunit D
MNILMVVGLLSMVTGGLLALVQNDLKRLLAYSTISQMGYITLSIGLGTQLGLSGGLFHMINHVLIKSLLFLCAGVVIHYAKTSDMYKIAGTIKSSPMLTYSFLIGVLSLGGIPFLNGFASKWLIYIATMQVNPVLTFIALLTTAMTLAYGLKAFYMIFMSNPNPSASRIDMPLSMSFSIMIIVFLCILLGTVPSIGYTISEFAAQGLVGGNYIGAVFG